MLCSICVYYYCKLFYNSDTGENVDPALDIKKPKQKEKRKKILKRFFIPKWLKKKVPLPSIQSGNYSQEHSPTELSGDVDTPSEQTNGVSQLQTVSIHCPYEFVDVDGNVPIQRLSPELIHLQNLKHIIMNDLQKDDIDVLTKRAQKLKSLLLSFSDIDHLYQVKDDMVKLIYLTHVFGIVQEKPAVDLGHDYFKISATTSDLSNTVKEVAAKVINTSTITESMMKLQDRLMLMDKMKKELQVDLWHGK